MCEAIVRLKDGETFASTQAALDVIAANLANTYPDTNRGRRFVLSPLQDAVVAATSPAVFMGFAGGVLLLVIACTNVIGLFLGEMPLRRRDFALRAALGASRARLIRQVVVEGALLAVAGCGAGLLVARAIVAWLKAAADLPRVDAIRFDAPVAIWLVGIAAASGMLARVAPLLWMRGSREDLRASLPVYTASAPALRRTLVALQLALTVVLSATAILLAVSLRTISSVDPGFAPSHTLAARVSAYAARYPDKAATARFVNDIVRRIAQLPGVEAAAAGQAVPLAGAGGGTSVGVEGRPVPLSERPTATWSSVTPGYFRALGVPLLGGRDFLHADLDSRTHQTIINRALARHLFGDENPIGRRLQFGPDGSPADWHEIVGIVGDVRQESLSGSAGPAAYDLFGQHWGRSVYVIARGGTDPYALTPAIRAIVHDIDPQAPVFDVRSLDDIVNGTIAPRRTATAFATSIAAVSLLLAAIGLYGLLASSVVSRTRELGIRRALGSTTTAIVNLVLAEAAILAAAGTVVGVAATLAVARVIQSQLFGIRATDFRVLAVVVITLATTGGIAAYLPARRAVRVDPVVALRDE
jgi:putative ABC transport system permease protein